MTEVTALTVVPRSPGSARLEVIPAPGPPEAGLLVDVLAVGVCGTDLEIMAGHHGEPTAGSDRLVLGHESLGRVAEAAVDSRFAPGDLVAGIVRRPDPVPCINCSIGEWDMCLNGEYTERGIKGLDGFLASTVYLEPDYAVAVPQSLGPLGVLVEPASVVAKAWEHIERIGQRARWAPQRVLVTGAGPIGLLAALMATQRGLEVSVFDRVTEGPKPALVEDLGASYHVGDVAEVAVGADVVVECTGYSPLVFDVLGHTGRNGIVCLTGVTSPGRPLEVPAGAISREMVLENDVVFGTVNANTRHYEKAVASLAQAHGDWLDRMITRRVPLAEWKQAFDRKEADVKVVLEP